MVVIAAMGSSDARAQEGVAAAASHPLPSPSGSVYSDFDDLFSHVRTIEVEGSAVQPLRRMTSMAARDTLLAIVDQSAHTLTVLGQSGRIHLQVGNEGAEPGELSNPDWVGFDALGRIVVKEWHANHRVQIFSAEDGDSEGLFSLQHGSAPTGQAVIEGAPGEQRIVFVTTVPCTADEEAYCVVQEQAFSGEIIRRFGPMEEIEPVHNGQPFVMGRDDEGRTYLAHRYGSTVTIFDSEGVRTGSFVIDGAPEVELLDVEAASQSDGEPSPPLEQEEVTMVRSLHVVGDHLIITHYRGYEAPHYFLTVFNRDGEVLSSGIDVDHPLQRAKGDRFFFVEEDLEADHGAYTIHEYRYDPAPLE